MDIHTTFCSNMSTHVGARAPHSIELREMRHAHLTVAGEIHLDCLRHGLFPRLGRRFLRVYLGTFIDSTDAVALVATGSGVPAGFLVHVRGPAALPLRGATPRPAPRSARRCRAGAATTCRVVVHPHAEPSLRIVHERGAPRPHTRRLRRLSMSAAFSRRHRHCTEAAARWPGRRGPHRPRQRGFRLR